MLLTELVLHNFGVYKGRQVVDLRPPSDDRPVILVGGLNGAGKTTFLDALQLSLYGHRSRTSNRGNLGYEEYLRHCVNKSVPATEGAALELAFEVQRDGATVAFRVRRQWCEQGKSMKERLDVWCDDRPDVVLAENWSDHVEELIPLEISALFFFDGEKIEALADPLRAQAVVRSAVHSLLGVSTVDRLNTDLIALQRRQRPLERDEALEARILELEAAKSQALQAREDAVLRLGRERSRLDVATRELERAESAFQAVGGELLARRKDLEAELSTAQAVRDRLQEDLRTLAAGVLPLALVRPMLADVERQAHLEREISEERQLAAVLEARDEDILKTLAGTLPDEAIREVAATMTADRTARSPRNDTEMYLELGRTDLEQLLGMTADIRRAQSDARERLEQRAAAEERITDLERTLAATPEEQSIAAQVEAREAAKALVLELRGRCAAAEEEKARIDDARTAAVQHLEQALRQRVDQALRSEDVARLQEHAERARATLITYRQKLLSRHLNKLEIAVLDSFSKLMRKQGLIKDLRIDVETFSLNVFDGDGNELRPARLSAGERQLLAVGLLWGLARVAGNRLPTIVDTPLGRLDSRHRQHLVERYFPYASRQVLLLSTDEEIDEELQSSLLRHVGHSYLITYDDSSHSSRIEPGYFWAGVENVA